MRLVKCYGYCNEKHPRSTMQKIGTQNYCPQCYDKKKKEVEDRELLFNCIKSVFNLNFPTGQMLRQIKQYREERNYTYKNIAFTIKYIVQVKNMQLQTKYGIALVPHLYDEMLDYYKKLEQRKKSMTGEEVKTRKIFIEPPKLRDNKKFLKDKLIDVDYLLRKINKEEMN